MVITRVLDGDDAAIAYLDGLSEEQRATINAAILACFIGPRLRADPRMQDVLEHRFGFPRYLD